MENKFSEQFFPMNTDASNVEHMNIHQIKERLSMSCIASFEEWSNIFRTRSFTLFKEWSWSKRKVRFRGGVRVHIIVIDDKLLCVLDELWEDHLSSMFHSE